MSDFEETIFSKIIRREVPADIVYETDTVLAFRDINPQAPTHILIIPKRLIPQVSLAQDEDQELLGELFIAAKKIASQEGLSEGFRLVVNNGPAGGQEVYHIHMHPLGGRPMSWPPG